MKKRFLALLLTAAALCSCAFSAFAADGFDETVVKNADDIICYESVQEDLTAYFVSSLHATERWYWTAEGDEAVLVYPCILVEDGKETYNVCFLYDSRSSLNIQSASFMIGGKSYEFRNIDNNTAWYGGGGDPLWLSTLACIELDAGSLDLLSALVEHRDENIPVHLVCEGTSMEITLGQPELDGIIHLYNLYVQAGGTRAANLSQIPSGSGTEFDISE